MVKFLPSALAIFIIICFAGVLNALENNGASNDVDSPEVASPVSSNKPSSGRIRPSAWSKEEKEDLKPNDDKNKEEDTLLNEESNLWNMKKLFHYLVSLLSFFNQKNDDSVAKLIDDLQIKMNNLVNNGPQDKSENNEKVEKQNSDNPNKSLNYEKIPNISNNSLNNRQPAEFSKSKKQNSTLNKSEDDGENQSSRNNNNLNKSSNDAEVQKSSDDDFTNNKQLTKNPKLKARKPADVDYTDESENDKQNLENPKILDNSATGGRIKNFSTSDTLNEPLENEKMQKNANGDSSKSGQLSENLKNNQQNSVDHSDKSTQRIEMQNNSNNGIQLESTASLEDDKPKYDSKNIFKDYETCSNDEMKLEDEKKGYDYENDNEERNNMVEDNVDEDETEDDYINDTTTETDTNENDVENDYADKNINGNKDKLETDNQNQVVVSIDKKPDARSTTLPKFIIQAIRDQKNRSETQPPMHQLDINDNVKPEGDKSQNKTNERNSPSEFQISSSEFIDEYINNHQEKISETNNKQPNNNEILITNENGVKNKIIQIQKAELESNLEANEEKLFAIPSVKENIKDQNMSFDKSQNTETNTLLEKNDFPLPIFNEDRKYSERNKSLLDSQTSLFPQNVSSSSDKIVFPSHEEGKVSEIIPLNFLLFQQKPHSDGFQSNSSGSQESYNAFTQPTAFDIQINNSSVKASHNDISATDILRPEVIVPFQVFPNKPINLEKEGYLNDQKKDYNFQNEKFPIISNEKNQQFQFNQPTILQQDIIPNPIQDIPKPNSPNTQDETIYFPKYNPETPADIPNIETHVQNTKVLPNNLISNFLTSNPSFINQESSATDIGSNMGKIMLKGHSEPQNEINDNKSLNIQNDNLTLQNNVSAQQMQFLQSDIANPLPQTEIQNIALPYESKMNLGIVPEQNVFMNTELPQMQNGTNNSKELPNQSFSNAETIQIKPKSQDSSSPVISESKTTKPQVRSSKPLIDERQKSTNFDDSGGQEQGASRPDSDSSNNARSDESPSRRYGGAYNEGKPEGSTTFSGETDTDDNEIEDDFVSENIYDYEDSTDRYNDEEAYDDEKDDDDYEDDDVDNYADENDEDYYAEENNQDDYTNGNNDEEEEEDEDDKNKNNSNTQKPKAAVTELEKTHENTTVSPKLMNQITPDQQSRTMTKPFEPQIGNNVDIMPESSKFHRITNEENSSPGSELTNGGFKNDYVNNPSEEDSGKKNGLINLSDGTINDAEVVEKSNTNYVNEPPEAFDTQTGTVSANQEGNFNTMLEYIYKHSNTSLFEGIRDENN